MWWLREGGRRLRTSCVGTLVLTIGLTTSAGVASGAYAPDAGELALLAFANEARAAAGLRPLVWHDGLGKAARAHSTDMADNDCYQHNSCNGQYWSTRISKYYPSYFALGENINLGSSDPRALHDGWMSSPGHRANILGPFTEFGAGIALGETNFGVWAYGTEDFGDRGAVSPSTIPSLPSGGISPRIGGSEARELIVNYYHYNGGAPQAVRALVGTSCVNLSRTAGSAANGSWGANRTFTGSGCVPVVFEAIRSDGTRVRWPQNEAVLVGVGAGGLYCAETTTAVPTQDCGGGGTVPTPTPTPTPAPAPTPTPAPGDDADLGGLRVAMKPGRENASAGTVNVQATLPTVTELDPTSGPVSIRISAGRSSDWQTVIPATCDDGPCFQSNRRETIWTAKVGSVTVSFVQGTSGVWKLRLMARKQTLGDLDGGTIDVTVSVDGLTLVGAAEGEIKPGGLFAN